MYLSILFMRDAVSEMDDFNPDEERLIKNI